MNNLARYLNKIILIRSATFEYAEVEVSGNTCFLGTNNAGKTSILRALLFFYNAETEKLGIKISEGQEAFAKYYFPMDTSYIIYEIKTPENYFHVWAFRYAVNAIHYRFVDCQYDKNLYIENRTVLSDSEIRSRFDDPKQKIDYTDIISTYKKYRNILYGAEEKKYYKYSLLRGNEKYDNIPKAITETFLSSQSKIDSNFVKDFIVNAISDKPSISLDQIRKKKQKFHEQYEDIEIFLKNKENIHYRDLAIEKYNIITSLKNELYQLATDLGSAYKFATQEQIRLEKQIENIDKLILELQTEFENIEKGYNEKNLELNQNFGVVKEKIETTEKKQEKYKKQGIEEKLKRYSFKENHENELSAKQEEYKILTNAAQDIETTFKTRFQNLKNEQEQFVNANEKQMLNIDKALCKNNMNISKY